MTADLCKGLDGFSQNPAGKTSLCVQKAQGYVGRGCMCRLSDMENEAQHHSSSCRRAAVEANVSLSFIFRHISCEASPALYSGYL